MPVHRTIDGIASTKNDSEGGAVAIGTVLSSIDRLTHSSIGFNDIDK